MKKGELWVLELPFLNGREQRGTRPCLILADTKTDMIVVIPLTSNLQALRFPHTVEIKKSGENKLEKDSIALIFQIQSLDKKRFINKIGVLEDYYLSKVDEVLKRLIQL
ncbi:type II toxin-antitoxin system PemK/MazF family toxin [Candidatus Woesearchaeota archaeon]|nr:type II toxin-antitoxin system PemK/MazF family toxin [Candidatus Woesearchaeota archaeon]